MGEIKSNNSFIYYYFDYQIDPHYAGTFLLQILHVFISNPLIPYPFPPFINMSKHH